MHGFSKSFEIRADSLELQAMLGMKLKMTASIFASKPIQWTVFVYAYHSTCILSLSLSLSMPIYWRVLLLPMLSVSFHHTNIKSENSIKFLSSIQWKTINVVLQRYFVPFISSSSSSTLLYVLAMNFYSGHCGTAIVAAISTTFAAFISIAFVCHLFSTLFPFHIFIHSIVHFISKLLHL